MKTASEYIDAIKARHGIESDYGVARLAGWDRTRVSHWRRGKYHFDEEACLKVADLLDIDLGF